MTVDSGIAGTAFGGGLLFYLYLPAHASFGYEAGRIYSKEFAVADAGLFPSCENVDPDRKNRHQADVFSEVGQRPGGAHDAGGNHGRKY